MQAGAYDTVLILFYFPLLLPPAALSRPLFSQRPTCTRHRYREPFSAYRQTSQVIISHYRRAPIEDTFVRGSKKENASRVNYSIYTYIYFVAGRMYIYFARTSAIPNLKAILVP